MDGQDSKITVASATAGHESHGVHLCHRCGWPFPNPHPSAKHRRAHKRVCGTVEGYKIIQSGDHDGHLAFSDDENASDEDNNHTPSPNIVKRTVGSSGGEGEKSAKSEDDVFSDAVTDFSDSGISPRLGERFESVRDSGKSLHQQNVEGDLDESEALKVVEAADRTEKSIDPRNEEISYSGPLANGNNQVNNVVPAADTAAKLVSFELTDDSQSKHGVGGSVHGEMIPGHDAVLQEQEHVSVSVPLDPEDGKVLDQTVSTEESQDALHDMAFEVAKHDPPHSSVSLQTLDASEGINNMVHSPERSTTIETVEVALADEGVEEVSHSTENIESTESVGEKTLLVESSASSFKANSEHSDVACTVSSIEKEEIPEAKLDRGLTAYNIDESEGGKFEEFDKTSLESKNLKSVDANSPLGSTADAYEDDIATLEKKDFDQCGENTSSTALETRNEKGEGASEEVEVIPNSMTPSEKLNDYPSSFVSDSDAKKLQELSETHSSSLEIRNDDREKSIQGHSEDKVTEVLQSVGSAGAASRENHDIGDALDKKSLPTTMEKKDFDHCGEYANSTALETGNEKDEGASVEVIPMTLPEKLTDSPSSCVANNDSESLQELSENHSGSLEIRNDGLEKSIQGHSEVKVTEVLQSVGSAGAASEENHDDSGDALDKKSVANNIHVAKEDAVDVECTIVAETLEHSISKESTSPDYAKDDSYIGEAANASDSIVTTEVTTKDHESNVVTREISESPTSSVPEASSDVKQTHSRDDLCTSKSVDIVPMAELTLDGKSLPSEECSKSSDAPSVKQSAPSPSDVQDFRVTSDTVDYKTHVNGKDVTSIDTKSVLPEVEDNSIKQMDTASAVDVSGTLLSRSESLEANCGSVVSDTLETNSQKHKTITDEAHPDKCDTFEPPSFMTLVQSGSEGDQVTDVTEIEAVQDNQQPKSDALQAGWFPSLTNVVNESEGRKKNEEMIAKVTNWSPVKQQHGPLKSLLSEVKSPNTKQLPAANQKVEAEAKDDNSGAVAVTSVIASETQTTKDQDTNKLVEEWNSPARYPIEIKKEKKKGRSFWVPFVCCSSAHRDL